MGVFVDLIGSWLFFLGVFNGCCRPSRVFGI